MRAVGMRFVDFCKTHKALCVFDFILIGIVFGCRIYSRNLSIDTDTILTTPYSTLNWLQIGRWGLVLAMKTLHISWFNPYISGVMTYCFIFLFLLFFSFFFYDLGGKESMNLLVFNALFVTHPIFAFQWFFQLQTAEISWSICLVGLALIFVFLWIRENNKLALALGILLMVVSFSCYEANDILYIAGALIGYLLLYKKWTKKEARIVCVKLLGSFLVGFVVNTAISKLFFTNSNYVMSSVNWGTDDFLTILMNVLSFVKSIVLGEGIFDQAFLVMGILVFARMIYRIVKKKDMSIVECLVWIGFLAIPFALVVITGGTLIYRSQYALPFVIAAGFAYVIGHCAGTFFGERMRIIAIVFAMIFTVHQTQTTLRLWYTDDVRYEQDCRMISNIVEDLQEGGFDYVNKPIAVIGKWEAPLDPSCYGKIEVFGFSYFDMCTEYMPFYYVSTNNIVKLAKVNAYQLIPASTEQIVMAKEVAQQMQSYPLSGYIREEEGVIVIKVGTDPY